MPRKQQEQASYERATAVVALTAQIEIVKTSDARLQIAEGTRVEAIKLSGELANNLSILLTAQAVQAAVPTPTPTPLLPNTPLPNTTTGTPAAAATPTAPPSLPSPPAIVNLVANATFAAIQQDLAQVQVAQTSVAETVANSKIKVGQVLRIVDWVNVRRSPGYTDKAEADVIGLIAPNTPVVIGDGPVTVDGIVWWQLQGVGSESRAVTGWVAESYSGEVLLEPFPPSQISLSKPFDGEFPISQYFGEHPELYSQFTYDGVPLKGKTLIDFALRSGVPVMATAAGVVLRVDFDPGGFGNFITLKHEWGESIYTHLDRVDVSTGQTVQRGEQLGLSGNSGTANGPFLGFGIRINPYERTDGWGGFSDPLPYLNLLSAEN